MCASAVETCAVETAEGSFEGRAIPVIATPRLTLRGWLDCDATRLVALANNYAVAKNLSRMPFPYTEKDAADWIALRQAAQSGNQTHQALVIALDDELIGGVGLGPFATHQHELGYWLGEPYWGRGYATEAARALIDWSFAELGLGVIAAGHFADNHASGRVLTKLGFRYTVEVSRACRARGHDVNCLEMALTRARWAERVAHALTA